MMAHGAESAHQRRSNYGAMSPTKSVQKVQPMAMSCHGLTVVTDKAERKILDNVSGMADPGQLVALMGASGAGKTTLLNTLLNRNLKSLSVEGQVLVNGHSLGRAITYVSGKTDANFQYVQQDDLFMGTLTVEQKELQMAQFVSGGEARRLLLMFASELLNNPQKIFADESTTGFNWSMADNVISVMRALTSSGHTIICTIHQPLSGVPKALLSYVSLPFFCGPIEVTVNLCCRAVDDLDSANYDPDEQMPIAQDERKMWLETVHNQAKTMESQTTQKDNQINFLMAQNTQKDNEINYLNGQLANKDVYINQLIACMQRHRVPVPPPPAAAGQMGGQ